MPKKNFSWIIYFFVFVFLIFTATAGAATISTSDGWNLKSSRIAITVADKFTSADKFASVWKWIPGADAKWAVYLPGEPTAGEYAAAKGFADLSIVSPGEGFWVNSKGSQSISVTGDEVTSTDISLDSGWNLKGLTIDSSINVGSIFTDAQEYASIWKWTGSKWAVYLPEEATAGTYAGTKGFEVLSTIAPGEGFWVNATAGTDVVATPPVIAGIVTYPEEETSVSKIALYKTGLLAEIPVVSMPPTPGVSVSVYAADDKDFAKPLATTKTDGSGNYSFTADDFVETPPQVPVIVVAAFKSPIDPKKKVQVSALVDPTDDDNKGKVEINPLTTAIAEKVKTFVEDTFKIDITAEIMKAAKAFIDLIAAQVKEKGLTNFVETDVQIGEYEIETPDTLKDDFVAPVQNLADNAIDKATGGLFESMESSLIEKAEAGASTLGTGAVLDETKKLEHFIKFFASIGFAVQAGADGTDAGKLIVFLPVPANIPDNQIPGVQMFKDRAFRKIDPAEDLTNEFFSTINDPGLIFQIKDTLESNPPMSYATLLAMAEAAASGKSTTLTKMAAVIKDKFEWKTESVQMINGIPMFSDYSQTPKTGADVTASELISKISGKLGDTPKAVAIDLASKNYYILDMAEMVINGKIHQINEDNSITDKKAAIDAFFKELTSIDALKAVVQASEEFQQEVENISRRIFAAFEPDLYGNVLSASTQLKIKTAFVLFNLMIDRDYLIEVDKGWYKTIQEGGITRIEPNFANLKWLQPKEESPGTVSEVLGLLIGTQITDGVDFGTLVEALHQAAWAIQQPDKFKMDMDMFESNGMGTMNDQVTINGMVKNYDGAVMGGMEINLKYFNQQGQIQDFTGGPVTTGNDGSFTFNNVDSGFPYEIRFTGNNFIFPFFADGFQPVMNMGEIWLPPPGGMGGPMGFPAVSLWIDQKFFNPMNPNDENNGELEGVDFSNFNTEKPFIIFEGSTDGTPDLFWTSADGLTTAQDVKIASLGEGSDHQHSLGSGPVINHVFTKAELAGTASITMENSTFTLSWGDSVAQPGEDKAVYVVKDANGKYFFIEVRWWDKDFQGNPNGMIDVGFAKLGTDGRLDVPKEDFMGGPGMGMPGGPGMNMFFDMYPGDYFDLETGFLTAPPQEPFAMYEQNAGGVTGYDIRWLGAFYDTYWANTTNWDTRNAYMSKSDRAISVINNATLSTIIIAPDKSVTITEVTEGVVKNILPGTMLLVETADQKEHIIGVNWVENDGIGLMVIPRDQMIDGSGNLQPGIEDGDGDGIPNILDNNDFKQDMFDQTWQDNQFQMIDMDGDGVSAEFDPNDYDPNVPFSGGDVDKDGDGLIGGADPDDNNPNNPVYNGNFDNDKDGWPKGIDPDDNDSTVPAEGEDFFGGGMIMDADGDGIPGDMDPDDDDFNNPISGGNQDNDNDGFRKGEEEWNGMGGQPGNDNDASIFPGSFNPGDVSIQVTGTAKVAVVWLKEDYPGAPPFWEFMSIYELTGLSLTQADGQYSLTGVTPANITGAIQSGWPQFGLNNARAEILLIDDVDTDKDGPQFDFYPGGDAVVGIAFGYELQMVNGTWQLNEMKPNTGPQQVTAETVDINFGPKY